VASRKALLILPSDRESLIDDSTWVPYGLLIIGAYVPESYDVEFIDMRVEPVTPDQMASASVILMTLLTSQVHVARKVAAHIHEVNPQAPIIIGGPHASARPLCELILPELLQSDNVVRLRAHLQPPLPGERNRGFAHCVVREQVLTTDTMRTLFEDLERGDLKREYIGVTRFNPVGLPWPLMNLIKMGLYRKPPKAQIMTSYGCPNACDYCQTPTSIPRYRRRPHEEVLDELALGLKRTRHGSFAILDDNLVGVDTRGALEFFAALTARRDRGDLPSDMRFYTSVDIRFAMDTPEMKEVREAFAAAGGHSVFLGVEHLSPEVIMDEMTKHFVNYPQPWKQYVRRDELNRMRPNISMDDLAQHLLAAMRRIQDAGISVHCGLMLGYDPENEQYLEKLREFALNGPDVAHFFIAEPFPGTPFFDKMFRQGRVLARTWDEYGQSDFVYEPRGMPRARYYEAIRELYATIGSERNAVGKAVKTLERVGGLRIPGSDTAGLRTADDFIRYTGNLPDQSERRVTLGVKAAIDSLRTNMHNYSRRTTTALGHADEPAPRGTAAS
jgi:radical SAM superfamily enzyme YgiQ (UPF0313 family)